MPIIFGVVFVLSNFLIVSTTWANSCRCVKYTGDTSVDVLLFPDGQECKADVSGCAPGNFGYQEEKEVITYSQTRGVQAVSGSYLIKVKCTEYLDNQCKDATTDIKSPVNNCWAKDACEKTGGQFDEEGLFSPDCKEVGQVKTARCFVKVPDIALQIAIPGVTDKICSNDSNKTCVDDNQCTDNGKCRPAIKGGFPGYIQKFAKFFIGMLAVAAVVMVMWGGFKRIIAAGNAERISDSNEAIFGAIIGLVLALISYTLLNLINPALIKNTGVNIDKVKPDTLGNWCPDPDPLDINKHYECGTKAEVGGSACIGQSCDGGKGCYKIGTSKEVDSNGKLVDYKCLYKNEACKSITNSNIEELHGVSTSDWSWSGDVSYGPLNSVCNRYSDATADCVWVHEISSNIPITSFFDRLNSRCNWYPKLTQHDRCLKDDGTLKTCSDFNYYSPWNDILYQVTTGDLFAACTYNWCPELNCKIVSLDSAAGVSFDIKREYACVNR